MPGFLHLARLAVLVVATGPAAAAVLPARPLSVQDEEWTVLSAGNSLDGWTVRGGKATYAIENGEIIGTTAPDSPNTFLCTDRMYSNFILEFECLVHPELNSGVQIRSNSLPDYRNGVVHGYQVEIDPSDRAWSGGIYDESRRGWLADLKQNPAARHAFRQNEWNHFRIEAIGNSIRTWINGVPAADLDDDETRTGFVALQVHGVGGRTDPLTVRWRNLRIQELPDDDRPVASDPTSPVEAPAEIFPPGAVPEKVAGGFAFTEGPAAGPDGRIWFSDVRNARIHVFDPATGETETWREESGGANGLVWTPSDALIACEGRARRVTRMIPGGAVETLADAFEDKKLNSPNDVALDNEGGLYFTDPRYGSRDNLEQEVEGVYYVARGGKPVRVIDNLVRPNGVALSPDCRTLYVADAGDDKIWKYRLDRPGSPVEPSVLVETGSDGMEVDIHGNVFLTADGQVQVVSPQGKLIARLDVPENPSNVAFGGPDHSTLYITARTSLYAVETATRGAHTPSAPPVE